MKKQIPQITNQPLFLSKCEKNKIAVPNPLIRSSLFSAIKRGKRNLIDNYLLASLDGIGIYYSGHRLDQADFDVWQYCVNLYKNKELSKDITISRYSILEGIGKNPTGKSNYEWLWTSLKRLSKAHISLETKDIKYSGTLISSVKLDNKTDLVLINLNKDIADLYKEGNWTQIDWEIRHKLTGKPLALWLHSFYSSHKNPFEYFVETIHELCGSETKEIKHFKPILQKSLDELSSVTGWSCYINEEGKVKINKKPAKIINK